MPIDLPVLRRLFFWLAYRRSQAPWDTNQTPPEVIAAIEGPGSLERGAALDIGCGTGTNSVYLARHGWEVVGVDFIPTAIDKARRKARGAGVAARFFVADVLEMQKLGLDGQFDLALDIGCFHGLPVGSRGRYVETVAALLKPAGTYMLYTFAPRRARWHVAGIAPEDVERLFAPSFTVEEVQHGVDRRGLPSAWFTMRRR